MSVGSAPSILLKKIPFRFWLTRVSGVQGGRKRGGWGDGFLAITWIGGMLVSFHIRIIQPERIPLRCVFRSWVAFARRAFIFVATMFFPFDFAWRQTDRSSCACLLAWSAPGLYGNFVQGLVLYKNSLE